MDDRGARLFCQAAGEAIVAVDLALDTIPRAASLRLEMAVYASGICLATAASAPLDMRTCLTLFSKVLKDCSSTRRNACAVISFVASFWRFQTPSRCVSASKCILHFGLTRTSNLCRTDTRETRRRSRGRGDGVAVRMRREVEVNHAESAPAHVEQ